MPFKSLKLCDRNLSSGGGEIWACAGRDGTSRRTTPFRARTQLHGGREEEEEEGEGWRREGEGEKGIERAVKDGGGSLLNHSHVKIFWIF